MKRYSLVVCHADSPTKFARQQNESGAPAKTVMQPLSLSLNIDGRTLAEAVSTALSAMYGIPGQAPAADGMGQVYSGDHKYPDK